MRTILLIFVGSSLMISAQTANPSQQAQQFYAKGVALEKQGDVAGAKEAYTQALRLNPKLADAQYRLGELKLDDGHLSAKSREAKFGTVIIPQFQLDGATLSESLEALRVSMEKASNGEVTTNFVVKDPDGKLAKSLISFQLKSVPAKAILDYILSQAGAKAQYDEHAVVIAPRS